MVLKIIIIRSSWPIYNYSGIRYNSSEESGCETSLLHITEQTGHNFNPVRSLSGMEGIEYVNVIDAKEN